MAKKQRRKSKTPKKAKKEQITEKKEEELVAKNNDMPIDEEEKDSGDVTVGSTKLTLAALDAISDEEGDDGDDGDEGDNDEKAEWNAEARALRQAIAEGAFDDIGKAPSSSVGAIATKVDEVQLENDSSEDEANDDNDDGNDNGKMEEQQQKSKSAIKALQTVTLELTTAKDRLPWAERFDVTPSSSLPFGKKNEEGNVVQVHDDLKRELAFYNLALEAVHVGRRKCSEHKIPLRRPEDFFAEMVKTDDHMAKVKDRLIFEGKKMDSFEQRKSNREQKLRAKEAHAHRLSEKAKSKKRHMQDVDDWAKSAASNRMGNNVVRDNDDDYLRQMNAGPNKKRQAMDKKYGYGGKRGRFKQNDRNSMNDMSGYNPKGNFAGGKKGGGNKRKGKRARDAVKARS